MRFVQWRVMRREMPRMMDKKIKKMLVDALVEVVDRAPLKKQMEFVGRSHNLRKRKTIENRGVAMQRRGDIVGIGSGGGGIKDIVSAEKKSYTLAELVSQDEKGKLYSNHINQLASKRYRVPWDAVQSKAEFEAWMGYVNKTLNTTSRYVDKTVFNSTQKNIQEIAVKPGRNYAAKTNDVCKAVLDYAQDIIYL